VDAGAISSTIAKEVFADMVAGKGDPKAIVEARGLRQVSDASAVEPVVAAVLEANRDAVEKFAAGNTKVVGFLVGQVMQRMGGKANPKLVNDLMLRQLKG
jgi:Asp-tRNA(Asn)/Glu-tRNA(Gln) amidotransferase B subunit